MAWEEDPDGSTERVAVIMKGEVYRTAGLKHSEHPELEGKLYDLLCDKKSSLSRDDVRKAAQVTASKVKDDNFDPSITWLDDFMRRFCLSKKKTGFYSKNMLKIKGKNAVPPSQSTKRSSRRQGEEDPPSSPHVKADSSSSSSSGTSSQVPAESATTKPSSTKAGNSHPVPKIKGKRGNSSKERSKENGGRETSSEKTEKVHENGEEKKGSKEGNSEKKVETVGDDRTKRQVSKNGNTENGQLDESIENGVDDILPDLEPNACSSEKDDFEIMENNGKVQTASSRGTRNRPTKTSENSESKTGTGDSSKSQADQKSASDSNISTDEPIEEMDIDTDSAVDKADSNTENINSRTSFLSSEEKSSNLDNITDDPPKILEDNKAKNDEALNNDSSKQSDPGPSRGKEAEKESVSVGNDTIVLDSDEEEDDIASAIAAADAVVLAAKRNLKMEVDTSDSAATSASANADHVMEIEESSATEGKDKDENVVDIAKSPPRFMIKVRNMAELLGGMSPVSNNAEAAPLTPIDDAIAKPDLAANVFDNIVNIAQKPEKGKSTLMSLFRTTTNHPNAQGSNSTVVRADTPTKVPVKEPSVNQEAAKKKDDTTGKKGDETSSEDDSSSKNKSKQKKKGRRDDSSDESDARKKKDGKFRSKGDRSKKDDNESKKGTTDVEDEEEDEVLVDTPESESSSEAEKSASEDLSNAAESDAVIGDLESSAESVAEDADENKKWESENVVSYTKKEDKQYKKSSRELLGSLQSSLVRCTGCNEQVNIHMANLVFTHPVLGTLICKRCRKFYGTGKFKKDADGLDEYCRLCANGGDLIVCDKCTNGFCKPCVRRNLSRGALSDIERAKEWSCYVCDMKPLTPLRLHHRAVLDNLREMRKKEINKSRTEKRKSAMADRFSALKIQRKVKEVSSPSKASGPSTSSGGNQSSAAAKPSAAAAAPSSSSPTDETVNDSAPWLSTCMMDLTAMLNVCVTQVGRVQNKWNTQEPPDDASARIQCSRRLLRLMRAMKDNFVTVEKKFLDRCGEDRDELIKMLESMNAEVGEGKSSATTTAAGGGNEGEGRTRNTERGKERRTDNKKTDQSEQDDSDDDLSAKSKLGGKKMKSEKTGKCDPKLEVDEKQVDAKLKKSKSGDKRAHETVSDCEDTSEPMDAASNVEEDIQENTDVRRTRSKRGHKEKVEEKENKPAVSTEASDESDLNKVKEDEGLRRSSRRTKEVKNTVEEDSVAEDSDTRCKKRKRNEKAIVETKDSDNEDLPDNGAKDDETAENDQDRKSSDDCEVGDDAALGNPCDGDDDHLQGGDSEPEAEGRRKSSRTADKELNYAEMADNTKSRSKKRKRKSTADDGDSDTDVNKSKKTKVQGQESDSECDSDSKEEDASQKKVVSPSVEASDNEAPNEDEKSGRESECEADTESDAQDNELKSKSPSKNKKKKKKAKEEGKVCGSSSEDEDDDKLPRLSSRKRVTKPGTGIYSDDDEECTEKKKKKKSSSRKKGKKDKYDDLDSDEFEKRKKAYKKRQLSKKKQGSGSSGSDENRGEAEGDKTPEKNVNDSGMSDADNQSIASGDESKSCEKVALDKDAAESDVDMFAAYVDSAAADDAGVHGSSSADEGSDSDPEAKGSKKSDTAARDEVVEPSASGVKLNTKKKSKKEKEDEVASKSLDKDGDEKDKEEKVAAKSCDEEGGEKDKEEKVGDDTSGANMSDNKKKKVKFSSKTGEEKNSDGKVSDDGGQGDKLDADSADNEIVSSGKDNVASIADSGSEKSKEGDKEVVAERAKMEQSNSVSDPDAGKVQEVKRCKPGPKSRVRGTYGNEEAKEESQLNIASSEVDKDDDGSTKLTGDKAKGGLLESGSGNDEKIEDAQLKSSAKIVKNALLDSDPDSDSRESHNSRGKKVTSARDDEKEDLLAKDFDKDEENLINKVKGKFANEEARETLLASDSENESKKPRIKIKLKVSTSNEDAKKDLLASDSDSDCGESSRTKTKKSRSSKLTNEEAKEDLLASDSEEEKKDIKKLKIKIKLRTTNEEAKQELLDSDSDGDTTALKKKKSKSKSSNGTAEYEIMSGEGDIEEEGSIKAEKTSSKGTSNDKAKNELLASSDSDSAIKKKGTKKSKSRRNEDSMEKLLNSDSDMSITTRGYKNTKKAGDAGKKATKKDKKVESEQVDSDSDDCLGIGRDEEDEESSSVSLRVRKRPKASPRQVQQRREERQLHKQRPVVQLQTLSTAVQEQLKLQDDAISYKSFKKMTRRTRESKKKVEKKSSKEAKQSEGEEEEGGEHDSDAEFKALMKFKLKKKISTKCTASDEEDDVEEGDKSDLKEGSEGDKEEKKDSNKKGHKKKSKEGLLDIKLNSDGEIADEEEEEEVEDEDGLKKKEPKKPDPSQMFNEKMKKSLLVSSDEEGREGSGDDSEDSVTRREREIIEQEKKKKYEKLKAKQKEKELKEKEEEGGEEEEDEEAEAGVSEEEEGKKPKAVGKKGYMSLKFSSDEEDDDDAGGKSKKDSKSKDDDEAELDEEEDDDSDDSDYELQRKSRLFVDSNSDSDFVLTSSKSRRGTKSKKDTTSSASSESDPDDKPKKKKRIRKASTSSEEDGAVEADAAVDPTEDTPSKKKHRRIIRDEDLTESTKNATQQEEDRRNRIKERQQVYNKIFEIDVETDQTDLTKLVLDFDPDSKKELVSVHPKLVPLLKPHQIQGIKFMWDATCESVERVKQERGSGAILAHCMGLGKTLQVIAFLHTLLTSKRLQNKIRRVMVLCPVNTVYNWVSEFKKWLKGKMLPFDVVELISAKDLWNKAYRLDEWHNETGVCIIGYDMFRTLSNEKNKKYKGKMKEIFQKTLVNPGPDLVICDEGHILKNEKSALSLAVNKVKTPRRVVLTGTPLQNNLKEYHCMIQFVKPNLLGTRKEFLNRFVNPISSGSSADATPRDVKRMKRRAHILHNLLEGCVQRFDYTVLKPFLPPKLEFVISVQMSKLQCELYSYYLEHLAQGGPKRIGSGLFVDFNCLSRVWTHPKVLELQTRRAMVSDDEEELEDFICDDETSESSEDERPKKKKKKVSEDEKSEESKPASPDVDALPDGLKSDGKVRSDWWKKIVSASVNSEDLCEDEWMNKIELSGKLVLLLSILRECCGIGDKVLLFSQSILALDMIEEFLALIDRGELEMPSYEGALPMQFKHWKRERDYLRLDGSVSADVRKSQCAFFNDSSNERCRLFLISTRAGGIGINLVAANRVIIFDSSWNPAHDTQSIFRVYRFGQKKPCYIYRFIAQGTMEEKIYSRQVNKLSTSLRVVDEHQIKRYFNTTELADLYEFNPADHDVRETPIVPEDRLLAELIIRHKNWIVGYHEHDSLLENQTSEELSEEERKAAWEDFENEKKGFGVPQFSGRAPATAGAYAGGNMPFPTSIPAFDLNQVIQSIYSQNPNLTPMQLQDNVVMATRQIQKIHLNHYQRVQSYVFNLKNPMIAPEIRAQLPYGNQADVLPLLESQLSVLEDNIRRENQVISNMQLNSQPTTSSLKSAGLAYGTPSAASTSRTMQYVDRTKATTSIAPKVTPGMSTMAPVNLISGSSVRQGAASGSGQQQPVRISSNAPMIKAAQAAKNAAYKEQQQNRKKNKGHKSGAEIVTLE